MQKLVQWAASQGDWTPSRWGLPQLGRDTDAGVRRWATIAGGLALLLSRVPETERAARFAASGELYARIRRRLRAACPVQVGAELLSDVLHEVAEVADPTTRACLDACFRQAVRAAAQARETGAQDAGGGSQLRSSQLASSRAQGSSDADTAFNSDLFRERSSALRRSVAAARSSGFADAR